MAPGALRGGPSEPRHHTLVEPFSGGEGAILADRCDRALGKAGVFPRAEMGGRPV
jgi:hypothetical protein